MVKRTYKCKHLTVEVNGSNQVVYCRLCKDYIISCEEIEREEMRLNKNETKKAKTKIKKTL